MRLATRLLWSHSVLAGVLLLALSITVTALSKMTSLISEVRAREFETLSDEEDVYRAAWAVEVAARHANLACARRVDGDAAGRIREALDALDARLARQRLPLPRALRHPVDGYRAFARPLAEGPVCARLLEPDLQLRRLALDEELTDAWIARLRELHAVVGAREERARRLGTGAAAAGLGLGLCAALAGVLVARWMARGVTAPLGQLARAARRLGDEDFSPLPTVTGPAEVESLAAALDRMRARLAELDQLKQGFVASVSHELRTPLSRLREALSLLEDGAADPLTPKQARVVRLAQRACEREIRIVRALLDLSRLQSGRALQPQAHAEVDRVLRVAVDDEQPEAESRGVTVRLDIDDVTPRAAMDTALVERAVANIVRNAVSVSPKGSVVTVARALSATGPAGEAGPWVRVSVRDEGPGVAAEARAKLFEAFASRPVPGGGARDGVGLGLALAREVMRAHGGDVTLADAPPPGATFILWLPLDAQRVTMEPSQ